MDLFSQLIRPWLSFWLATKTQQHSDSIKSEIKASDGSNELLRPEERNYFIKIIPRSINKRSWETVLLFRNNFGFCLSPGWCWILHSLASSFLSPCGLHTAIWRYRPSESLGTQHTVGQFESGPCPARGRHISQTACPHPPDVSLQSGLRGTELGCHTRVVHVPHKWQPSAECDSVTK